MKKDITGLFVFIDDFCKAVDEYLSRVLISCTDGVKKVTRVMGMTLSELLTIEIFLCFIWRSFLVLGVHILLSIPGLQPNKNQIATHSLPKSNKL